MTTSAKPLLIVNADDLGWFAEATDQTLRAFQAGRLTSATALVHMEDSDRAAAMAVEVGLPTGLHINLTDPFTDPTTPTAVRLRHLRACAHFSGSKRRLRFWAFDPRIRGDVEAAIADQLERFEQLFGGPPSHVDGHNHVHVCPNVALAAPLRVVHRRRNALWSWPSKRTALSVARAARRALTYRSFLTTRYFLSVHEFFGHDAASSEQQLRAAQETSVEVMAHPGFPSELEGLMSSSWADVVERMPTGSYRDLTWPNR